MGGGCDLIIWGAAYDGKQDRPAPGPECRIAVPQVIAPLRILQTLHFSPQGADGDGDLVCGDPDQVICHGGAFQLQAVTGIWLMYRNRAGF